MSKPYIHARSSARRFGGVPEDYLDIHEFFDSSKAALADVRHRCVLHSAFGIFIVEKMFGSTRKNSEGKVYSVRDIGEQHVMEDLGFIPSLEQWVEGLEIQPWMMGKREKKAVEKIPFDKPAEPAPAPAELPAPTPSLAEQLEEIRRQQKPDGIWPGIKLPVQPAVPLPYVPPREIVPSWIPHDINRAIAID